MFEQYFVKNDAVDCGSFITMKHSIGVAVLAIVARRSHSAWSQVASIDPIASASAPGVDALGVGPVGVGVNASGKHGSQRVAQ